MPDWLSASRGLAQSVATGRERDTRRQRRTTCTLCDDSRSRSSSKRRGGRREAESNGDAVVRVVHAAGQLR